MSGIKLFWRSKYLQICRFTIFFKPELLIHSTLNDVIAFCFYSKPEITVFRLVQNAWNIVTYNTKGFKSVVYVITILIYNASIFSLHKKIRINMTLRYIQKSALFSSMFVNKLWQGVFFRQYLLAPVAL